ncbi:hypothetical protein V1511DRAFT_513805 [Dipodascopsis uninucleata]
MTRKISSDDLSKRARENQRCSRARRKEYVQSLEQRLRAFEKQGVSVTKEIQLAGRRAAEENTLLRSLLRIHGVAGTEIDQFLQLNRNCAKVGQVNQSSPYILTPILPKPLSLHVTSKLASKRSLLDVATENVAEEKPYHVQCVNKVTPPEIGPASQGLSLHSRAVQDGYLYNSNSSTLTDNEQSMSCEAAAEIVSAMRYYSSSQDVLTELGCDISSTCQVKHMTISELLER